MPSDEVRGELGAQLLESVDRTWCQSTEPNPSGPFNVVGKALHMISFGSP